jgi:hypothetical protein
MRPNFSNYPSSGPRRNRRDRTRGGATPHSLVQAKESCASEGVVSRRTAESGAPRSRGRSTRAGRRGPNPQIGARRPVDEDRGVQVERGEAGDRRLPGRPHKLAGCRGNPADLTPPTGTGPRARHPAATLAPQTPLSRPSRVRTGRETITRLNVGSPQMRRVRRAVSRDEHQLQLDRHGARVAVFHHATRRRHGRSRVALPRVLAILQAAAPRRGFHGFHVRGRHAGDEGRCSLPTAAVARWREPIDVE